MGVHFPNLSIAGLPARPSSGGAPTPPAALSDIANLSFHWNPESITPQANDTAINVNWVDSVGSLPLQPVATAGQRPVYRNNVLNGKPSVYNPDGIRSLLLGRPAAWLSMLDLNATTTGYTILIAVRNTATTGNRIIYGPNAVNDFRTVFFSPTTAGPRAVGLSPITPGGNSGFAVIAIRCSTTIGGAGGGFFYNGLNTLHTTNWTSKHATNDYYFGGEGLGNASYGYIGDIFDIVGFSRALTNAEIVKAMKILYDKYGQPYPWAATPVVDCYDGDSYSIDTGTAFATPSWSSVLHTSKGYAHRAGHLNMAVSGRSSNLMTASAAQNWAGLEAELGVKAVLVFQEYYNQPDATASGIIAYANQVKAVAPELTTLGMSAWDNGQSDSRRDNRAGYNAAFMGAGLVADFKAPIHTDANMGIEGACPNSPGPYGPYFQDAVGHPAPTSTPHNYIASFLSPYWDTAVAAATLP